MKRLTKADLLKGTGTRETIAIDGMDGQVTIRPLTDGEISAVQALALDGLPDAVIKALPGLKKKIAAGAELGDIGLGASDLAASQKNDTAANYLAAASGMSVDGETWTPEEVAALPAGIPGVIAKAVFRLSGMTKEGEAAARKFRNDPGSK